MWASSPGQQHRRSPAGMSDEWRGPRPGPAPHQHRYESFHTPGYGAYPQESSDPYYRSRSFPPPLASSPQPPYPYGSSYPPHAPAIQTIQTRPAAGQTYFHPYHPKAKPLLFVNTVSPSGSSPHSFTSDALSQLKPKRKRITPEQLTALTALFEQTDSPSFDVREKLGAQVGMTNREVQVWMQNRRAKMNRLKAQAVAATEEPLAPAKSSTSTATPVTQKSKASVAPSPPNGTHEHVAGSSSPPPVGQLFSFRIPNPRRSSPPRTALPGEVVPSQIGPHRRVFHGQPIEIPSRSSFVPGQHQPFRSPTLPYSSSPGLQSPYSATFSTPSLSTPSLNSPGFSSSSSYFSPNTDPYTPSVSSPSSTFFRLSLESPSMYSPRSEAGYFSDQCGDRASSVPTEGERLIRLPPIVTPGAWDRGSRGHKRASSDGGPSTIAISTKLPSLQGLVQSIEVNRSGVSSAPSSPEDTRESRLPSASSSNSNSPGGVPRSTRQRIHHARPSSLSNILPRTTEEEAQAPEVVVTSPSGFAPALGLGMLEAAASEIAANEQKSEEEEKLRILAQARRMSVDVASSR